MALASPVLVPRANSDLLAYVETHSGQNLMRCFQCGKCTSGCPLAYAMDLTPRQVLRSVQLGIDDVLRSDAIRLCVSCQTCAVRCPVEIDVPRVMAALVQRSDGLGLGPPRRDVPLFGRLFLGMVERGGRSYELGLAGLFNLLSGHPFANLSLLPTLLRKGKLPLSPQPAAADEMQRIFARAAAKEGNGGGSEAGGRRLPSAAGWAALALAAGGVLAIFRRTRSEHR